MAKSIKKDLENYIEELKKEKLECEKWNTEEMNAMYSVYDEVITKLENILSK